MHESEIIILEGSNFFRQYLVYSILSGRRISIRNIRPYDDSPGIKGTQVDLSPGTLQGGSFEFQCGTERCISYFLEPLIFLAPFCKIAINGSLKGLTNVPDEISVDAINSTWLPVFSRFVPTDDDLYLKVCFDFQTKKFVTIVEIPEMSNPQKSLKCQTVNFRITTVFGGLSFQRFDIVTCFEKFFIFFNFKINARGFLPDAGGSVTFCSPIKKNLRPVQFVKPGKICKIRGLAYVCKVSPSIASRMIEAAKKMLHGYISDVYITIDQRKGPQGGLSPGFGIFITASTTEGVSYFGEAMSNPKDSQKVQLIPEEIGAEAAKRLLNEIYKGGCTDSSAQALATTFMTLCDKDVSKFLFGPLSFYCVHTMRNLRLFFNHTFKLDELWKLEKKEFDEEKKRRCTGSEDKCLLTCVGTGYYNINKILI
ncbi:unnamed protein product [Meloidogyne enterolobii]|uniref:Uncharacterized protein n=1 Tax=Meloidogyne enterolobii TaxID=390850 RepID=A0ACB0ZTC7_MELEN